jgi:hypothetical protein
MKRMNTVFAKSRIHIIDINLKFENVLCVVVVVVVVV